MPVGHRVESAFASYNVFNYHRPPSTYYVVVKHFSSSGYLLIFKDLTSWEPIASLMYPHAKYRKKCGRPEQGTAKVAVTVSSLETIGSITHAAFTASTNNKTLVIGDFPHPCSLTFLRKR